MSLKTNDTKSELSEQFETIKINVDEVSEVEQNKSKNQANESRKRFARLQEMVDQFRLNKVQWLKDNKYQLIASAVIIIVSLILIIRFLK